MNGMDHYCLEWECDAGPDMRPTLSGENVGRTRERRLVRTLEYIDNQLHTPGVAPWPICASH